MEQCVLASVHVEAALHVLTRSVTHVSQLTDLGMISHVHTYLALRCMYHARAD